MQINIIEIHVLWSNSSQETRTCDSSSYCSLRILVREVLEEFKKWRGR